MAVRFFLCLWLSLGAVAGAQTVAVRGVAEDVSGAPVSGVRLEFLPAGSSQRIAAATGADGKYAVSLAPGAYEILAYPPGQAKPFSGRAWLEGREAIIIDARIPKGKFEGHLEYDFLGEWRVTDENGRGLGPASVVLEAIQKDGKRLRFPVYIPAGDGEKETDGKLENSPDGRFIFRIREAHLLPENVVALVLSAEMPGFHPNSKRVYPALQFSETGHLFAAYPEEDVVLTLKRR